MSNKSIFDQNPRRAKRYRIIKIRRFILAVIVLVLIAALGFFGVRHLLDRSGYSSESGFEKFAKETMKSIDGDTKMYGGEFQYEYGEPMSFATVMPATGYEAIDTAIADVWAQDRLNFENDNQTVAQQNQVALMAAYEASATPYDAESVAVHTYHYSNIDDAESLTERVDCYNIATKTGGELTLSQMFYGDYNSVFKQEADAYLQEKYADYLTEDYAAQIDAAAENFILTEDGVKFFFNSGTVASADQGAISMTIPYEKFDGVIRTDIGKRIIDPNKPMVALTYDDGPSVDNSTDRILDVMEKYDVVCTFFELGERVDEEGDRGQSSCSANSNSAAKSALTPTAIRTSTSSTLPACRNRPRRASMRSPVQPASHPRSCGRPTATAMMRSHRSSVCPPSTGTSIHSTGPAAMRMPSLKKCTR